MLDRLRLALAILRHKHPMYPIGLTDARVKRVTINSGHLTVTLTARHGAYVNKDIKFDGERAVIAQVPTTALT